MKDLENVQAMGLFVSWVAGIVHAFLLMFVIFVLTQAFVFGVFCDHK